MGDEHVLSFLLGEALGVAYLNYMVRCMYNLSEPVKLFPEVVVP